MKDKDSESSTISGSAVPEVTPVTSSSDEHQPILEDRPVAHGNKFYTTIPEKSSRAIDADGSTVHVVARVRPLNEQEKGKGGEIVHFPGSAGLWLDNQGNNKQFAFDAVFEPGSSQKDVFDHCGIQRLLDLALSGYACTAFAFGQTGSGKTYTMTGPVTPENELPTGEPTKNLRSKDSYGLIQYSFDYLFKETVKNSDLQYTITASYMEIYNEQVQDLLEPSRYESIAVRWSKASGFHAENLHLNEIESLEDLMDTLEVGMKNRAVAAHSMNDHSSRSHSVLTVHLDSEMISSLGLPVTKHGKISFVDLAGSEKVKSTGSSGEMLLEATNINKSLLALGNCISALSDDKKRTGHIPFRDSKLTKLLADSLGGTGVTLMIACISPAKNNLSESLNTLRYAKRAKKIKNRPVIHMDAREELILKIQKDMNLLKQENAFLRSQLNFPENIQPRNHENDIAALTQRPVSENSLYGMLQEYMVENESLRNENENLLTQHTYDEREFLMLSRENGKLNRKLEDLERLVLSSPLLMTSNGNSRTNSGHLSLRTIDSHLTPISQSFHKYQNIGPNGSTFPNYALPHNGQPVVAKQQNQYGHQNGNNLNHQQHSKVRQLPQVMKVWGNGTPKPQYYYPQQQAGNLPPLKRTPPVTQNKYNSANLASNNNNSSSSKWEKAQSYAKQLKQRRSWPRVNNQIMSEANRKKNNNDVMSDFPMKDYFPPKRNDVLRHQDYVTPRTMNTNQNMPQQRQLFHQETTNNINQGKAGYLPHMSKDHHQQAKPEKNVLPQDAYRTVDISPRGVTKELSATSLRKMNNKMREELKKYDNEIMHYQKTINAS